VHHLVVCRISILLWSEGERCHVFVIGSNRIRSTSAGSSSATTLIRKSATASTALLWSRRLVVDVVGALHHPGT
jgi:hypothetical protein